ncbi:MAG: M20/M25/M40 family metallo-hydrolase [Candidatus Bathyarchaeia archaeon]
MIISEELAKKLSSYVDEGRVTALASKLIGTPSWQRSGQEEVAKYCAAYMEGMGMDVQLQEIVDSNGTSVKQAIGCFPGAEGGPSLLLCSHLDTLPPYKPHLWKKKLGDVEDGFIYGVGGQKCGMAAMMEAARAVNKAIKLKGDLVVACLADEMRGGLGIQHLLNGGLKPDAAIVGEDTDLQLVTISVAGIFGKINIDGRPDRPKGLGGIDPLDKMVKLLQELKAFQPMPPDGWLTFLPHKELPGYPRFNIVSILLHPFEYPTSCSLLFDCRIVPGQSEETVRRDLEALLKDIKAHDPNLVTELTIPAPGWFNRLPFEISPHEPIVKTIAKWHEYVVGTKPYIGSGIRLGFASDANNLLAAGVKCVNYGPGDFREPIDERKKVRDMVKAAKVYALAAAEICG